MVTFIDQVLSILTTSPGNLAYHLVLAFTIAAAFQISLPLIKRENFPEGRRLLAGLALLLFVRLLLFLTSTLAWQSVTPLPEIPLAILDRTVTAFSLLIIIWLWAFPQPNRQADRAFTFLGLFSVLFFILSLVWWSNDGQLSPFNSSLADVLWQTFTIFLIFLGGILLIVRLPEGWGIGLVFLIIMFFGHLVHLVSPVPDSDYPGIVRLAQMAAYPLLFFLPQRFSLIFSNQPQPRLPDENGEITLLLNQDIINSIRDVAIQNDPTKVYPALTLTIAHTMAADACLFVSSNPADNRIIVRYGYDLIREETVGETSFNDSHAPLLANSVNEERTLIIPAGTASIDQVSLGNALNLSTSGPILAAPLLDTGGASHLCLILLSPYSHREWDQADQDTLTKLIASFAPALIRSRQFQELENQIDQAEQAVKNAEMQINKVSSVNETLIAKISDLQNLIAQEQSRAEGLAALISTGNTDSEFVKSWVEELELDLPTNSKETQIELADNDSQSIQAHLSRYLKEIDHLRSSLSIAEKRIQTLEKASSTYSGIDDRTQTITSITKEFRLPLSSIIGYTEVLLTSSRSDPDTPQKKLLERIKTSTQRLAGLLEDLAQLTDVKGQEPAIQSISLMAIIEESIALTHHGIRRKKISLKTNIPERIPKVIADRQVLRNLIVRIIQQAIKAAPPDGTIEILVSDKGVDIPEDSILVQISDNGPGIPPIELSQVFTSSVDTTETPLDDTDNLPLSTLKRMFETQGGHIWVDSPLEQGTTFSLLLPVFLPSHLAFSHLSEIDEAP